LNKIKFRVITGKILRLFGWWFGISCLYAMFSVCPFCGRPGCPAGAGSAGLAGGISVLLLQNWKIFMRNLKAHFKKERQQYD
jgi:hypothetical protein